MKTSWLGTITKFNQSHVVQTRVGQAPLKATVCYRVDNRADGRACVTLSARKYQHCLGQIIPDAFEDHTELTTDDVEQGKAVLFPGHKFYQAARCRAELNLQKSRDTQRRAASR